MIVHFLDRLRAALRNGRITKRSLAEAADLHPNTLLGCETDAWNPRLDTLRKLEPHVPAPTDPGGADG